MNKDFKPMLQSVDQEIIERSIGMPPENRIALERLLIEGKLEGVAKGVCEQVLTRGLKSLSEKQQAVLDKYVIKKHKLKAFTEQ
ncbi:MAG: hypothetical protein HN790_17640 [Methylococcales bacterium]|jgi:hypothetical protein|nr:hypothetical protein [Methylococcales bacterium]